MSDRVNTLLFILMAIMIGLLALDVFGYNIVQWFMYE